MFQQTTGLKALSSVVIFKKIEDHFEQNPPDKLRENSRQKWVDKIGPDCKVCKLRARDKNFA